MAGLEDQVIRELRESQEPLSISEVAQQLEEPHDEVRRVFNDLSNEKRIAGTPDFKYEWMGEQDTNEP